MPLFAMLPFKSPITELAAKLLVYFLFSADMQKGSAK